MSPSPSSTAVGSCSSTQSVPTLPLNIPFLQLIPKHLQNLLSLHKRRKSTKLALLLFTVPT